MDRETLLRTLVLYLGTLAETLGPNEGCAESTLYMAVGMDIELSQRVIRIARNAGLITVRAHQVFLTPEGRERGEDINTRLNA